MVVDTISVAGRERVRSDAQAVLKWFWGELIEHRAGGVLVAYGPAPGT